MNSLCVKLFRAYSISFNSSNVGKFFWSWILEDGIKVQEKKNKFVVLCYRPRQNAFRKFHVACSRVTTAEKCTKNVIHAQSCCFANLNPLLFCRSRCRRRRRCLSSLIDKTERRISFSRLMYELVLSFSSALSLLCCDHSKETSLMALSPWHCLLQFCSQHQIWKFSLFWQFLDSVFVISGIMKVSVSVICLCLRPGSDASLLPHVIHPS